MTTLFAAPWVGEFGYEIVRWQGYVRRKSRDHKRTVVACRRSSSALYADFADEFIYIPHSIENCDGRCADPIGADADSEIKHRAKGENGVILRARGRDISAGEFIKYGTFTPTLKFDFVIHARMTPKQKLGASSLTRNYPVDKWAKMLEPFLSTGARIASIGLSGEALHIPGTTDFRDQDLDVVMALLASSTLIVGPSSGPIHLAAMCGCPACFWAYAATDFPPGDTMERRFKDTWNPLRTPVRMIDSGQEYDPDIDKVVEAIWDMLE